MKRLRTFFQITAVLLLALAVFSSGAVQAAPEDDLVIIGAIDGPLTGGHPKAIALYAINNIPDLSIYGFGSANNGGGSDGEEFSFPADAAPAGTCLYVTFQAAGFNSFFGFDADYVSSAAQINGDDAIELFTNGVVTDVFGDINTDGTGEPWDHVDGWAYRNSNTGPDGSTFVLGNWTFSGTHALDNETTNDTATTPFPIGDYAPCLVPDDPPTVSSTTPADSDTNVALDANIEITFSEDVTATDPWAALSCTTSGSHAPLGISGGPQTYTIDPTGDFVNDESCTVTVTAAQIADQDGTADNMVANFEFTFDTEASAPTATLVINEIQFDPHPAQPPNDPNGDANGDGNRDGVQDEFIELVNNTGGALDISGWTISDAGTVQHTFPNGTIVPDQCAIVVFGGGTPTGSFGDALVQTASTSSLSLNNGGDTVTLNDGNSDVASYVFGSEGVTDESLTRDPDITGSEPLVGHSSATDSGGTVHSPGTQVDGTPFSGCAAPPPSVPQLLLSEVIVTPTGGEFVEIFNPGVDSVDLSNVYLTDATFSGGSVFYYQIVTGGGGGGGFFDFHARFPDGATIGAGEYQTVAIAGSDDFFAEYGVNPTYELYEDGGSADGIPDMREARSGSIDTSSPSGLTNGGEIIILYYWDGNSDLVTDLDYLVWGDKDEAVDKTGVSIDGPDADSDASTYLADTAIASQDPVDTGSHEFGASWQREDNSEGAETKSGGNGADGHDETSEDLSNTWCENTPTPNRPTDCDGLIISEIMYNPSSSDNDWEWVEVYNNGIDAVNLSGFVFDDGNSSARGGANIAGGTIAAGGSAVLFDGDALSAADFEAAWGPGNYVPVTGFESLNQGGDKVGLWGSFASYSGDHENHVNALVTVTYTDDPPFPNDDGNASIYLTDLTADANDGNNWALSTDGGATPVFTGFTSANASGNSGADVGSPSAGLPDICGDPATLIHAIQGSGLVSLESGNDHTIEAVVVGDYQDTTTGLRGFFVQEEDGQADGNADTSEGIFVFDTGFGVDVNVGDLVRVSGTVSEFGDPGVTLTQLGFVTAVQVCSSDNNVTPTSVSLPVSSLDDWEPFEGMLVEFSQTLYVTEHFNLGRFGNISLSGSDRLFNPTHVAAPGAAANAVAAANDLNRIELDDANTQQNRDPIIYPDPGLSATNTVRGGDTVANLTGVLDQRFDIYRIQPVGSVDFTHNNPRPASPDSVGGSLQIATMNVLNYFTTLDLGDDAIHQICGPAANLGCRGANTASELTRQRDKIVNALVEMDADVVGLVEIENDAAEAALNDLVSSINAVAGGGTYAALNTGPIGTDAIRVAFIYKPATMTPTGPFAVLDSSFDAAFNDDKNRPVLAQTFMENATGEKVTVAVNHLKSKGSPCDDVGDPNAGDEQGNCNGVRTAAATVMANWLATDPTGSKDPDFLIIGDLNAYRMEDPIAALENAGYTNLVDAALGTAGYSYVFAGEWGNLDHALANADLLGQVTGTTVWHINADEPRSLDYNEEFKSAGQITSLYNDEPYRASDHDPVIVGLDLSTPFCQFGYPLLNAIYGTPGNDRIKGTPGDDVIVGLGGNDRIEGLGGNDCIIGGEGSDRLIGGEGNDVIWGGELANTVVYDRRDRDRLYGEEGNDELHGGGDHDHLEGDEDDDELWGDDGNDGMHGDDGDDTMYGGNGRDRMDGRDGNDMMFGGEGDDTMIGRDGNDTLEGDAGRDRLEGGDGDDTLRGGSENDRMNGGDGNDQMWGDAGEDSMQGRDGEDIMYGGDDDDDMNGGRDNDEMHGGNHNDRMNGDRGDDMMFGDDGDDILDARDGEDHLEGGNDDDELKGGKGDDFLDGGADTDELDGHRGEDTCINGESLKSCELP
ncbi:MAG: ExeM/NucH family extracellular endonuclease [Chloroflexota bacterium]